MVHELITWPPMWSAEFAIHPSNISYTTSATNVKGVAQAQKRPTELPVLSPAML